MADKDETTKRYADDKEVNTYLISRVKEIRVGLDSCIVAIDDIISKDTTKVAIAEYTLSKRKAQEAKHWLGEALGQLGQQLPEEYQDKAKSK